MLEIEMKFPVADFQTVQQQLAGWQSCPEAPRHEADHYFNAPDRDFAKTDEAFRLRCVGQKNILTYKGPKHPGPTKTRTEIELPLAEGPEAVEKCRAMLLHLGYRPVAVVRKQRIGYHLEREGFPIEVTLDDVEEVGHFVEVEIVSSEESREHAQQVIQALAAELHLTSSEKRSYLEMLLERREKGS